MFPLPCGSISLSWRRQSFSETTSLTVVHWMSGNTWSYWDSQPMAFFDCPRGHRVKSETHALPARA